MGRCVALASSRWACVTTGRAEELDTQESTALREGPGILTVTAQGLAPSGHDEDNSGCSAE